MLRTRFDIQDLTRAAGHVALLVPAGEVFSLLARSITIPAGWIALATRNELDPLVLPGGQRCDAQDVLEVLFVRAARFECTAQHETLQSADGFACLGRIRVPVRVLADRAELSAFRKALLGSSTSLMQSGLDRFLQPHLQRALCDLAESHTAAQLVAGPDAARIREAVDRRLGPACLTAGLAVDGVASVTFESPAWIEHDRQERQLEQRRRRTEARARIQEALAAAQRQQLDHLLTVLKSLTDAADGRSISLPDLLAGISDEQRGQLYAATWHLPTSAPARYVAAVSGQEVLLFERDRLEKPDRRLKLPETLGPLRSISRAPLGTPGSVFVGAARGVHLVDLESGQTVRSFPVSTEIARPVQGGFNAVAASDHDVFATHSELGLIRWRLEDTPDVPGRPLQANLTRSATAVRCASVAEGHLWFTTDASLWSLPLDDLDEGLPTRYCGGEATLSAICFDHGTVYAADAAGAIRTWEVGEPDAVQLVRNPTGQPVESLQVIDTCGVQRLIIADRSRGLTAMVLGDAYTRRYEVSSAIVRRAAAAGDLLVAMNDNRDRLIAWDPRRADGPIASVVIPHLTGASLQDLMIVTA